MFDHLYLLLNSLKLHFLNWHSTTKFSCKMTVKIQNLKIHSTAKLSACKLETCLHIKWIYFVSYASKCRALCLQRSAHVLTVVYQPLCELVPAYHSKPLSNLLTLIFLSDPWIPPVPQVNSCLRVFTFNVTFDWDAPAPDPALAFPSLLAQMASHA